MVWVKDASQMVIVAAKLTNRQTKDEFIAENLKEQEALRQKHTEETIALKSLEEARKNKLNLF